jgi:hypothetical protein
MTYKLARTRALMGGKIFSPGFAGILLALGSAATSAGSADVDSVSPLLGRNSGLRTVSSGKKGVRQPTSSPRKSGLDCVHIGCGAIGHGRRSRCACAELSGRRNYRWYAGFDLCGRTLCTDVFMAMMGFSSHGKKNRVV